RFNSGMPASDPAGLASGELHAVAERLELRLQPLAMIALDHENVALERAARAAVLLQNLEQRLELRGAAGQTGDARHRLAAAPLLASMDAHDTILRHVERRLRGSLR